MCGQQKWHHVNSMPSSPHCQQCQSFVSNHISSNMPLSRAIMKWNVSFLWPQQAYTSAQSYEHAWAIISYTCSTITSWLVYHGYQAVSTGSFKVFIEYLDDVIGTCPSMSPLQVLVEISFSIAIFHIKKFKGRQMGRENGD